MKVVFTEKNHVYLYGDEVYSSVSSLFKDFQEPFEGDKIAGRKAAVDHLGKEQVKLLEKLHGKKTDKFFDVVRLLVGGVVFEKTVLKYREEWAGVAKRGTAFHTVQEEASMAKGVELNEFDGKEYPVITWDKEWDNEAYSENLLSLPDGYYPELLVFNHDHILAGQADRVFVGTNDDKSRWIDIDDYKTDRVITTSGFYDKGKGKRKLLGPLSHLYDCKKSAYEIKISAYAWMLEQFGFQVRNLSFTHYVINDELEILEEPKKYPLFYRKWEIEQMLEWK